MRRPGLVVLFCLPLLLAVLLPDLVRAATASRPGLSIVYEETSNPDHREVRRILKKTRLFEDLARDLNQNLEFPVPLVVRFTDCDEENAYYDPETREISMCYELIEKYRHIYDDEVSTREEVEQEVLNAALFTFFHELGHGLVDVLELPITGGEEDAVDEFAAVTLLNYGGDQAESALLAAVDQFALDAEESQADVEEIDDLPFWDTHSLDQQRLYNLLCVIYGSDPERYEDLVSEDLLPEDRASGCEEEYERKARVWEQLMEPHLKGS